MGLAKIPWERDFEEDASPPCNSVGVACLEYLESKGPKLRKTGISRLREPSEQGLRNRGAPPMEGHARNSATSTNASPLWRTKRSCWASLAIPNSRRMAVFLFSALSRILVAPSLASSR